MSDCIGTGCKADAMMAQIAELQDELRDLDIELVRARREREAARAEISARSDLMQGYLDCWRNDKARAERAEADLTAARALLRDARKWTLDQENINARIDAALRE